MSLKKQFENVEKTFRSMGIDPEMARNEEEGQWTLYSSDKIEMYIDVWPAAEEKHWSNYFGEQERFALQVIAPVVFAPDDTEGFYADMMDMNIGLYSASLISKKDEGIICVKYRVAVKEVTEELLGEALDIVSYYAELMQNNLSEMYGLQKVEAGG
jgi:hypothetical protein